jgi:DNA-binding transcriptional LysR family regulator
MRLNWHQLLLFHTVARLGSVSRAAVALGISQPSVSAQLRAFEQRYEVKLLRRYPRGVVMTDAGRVVFDYADKMFSVARDLESALDALCKADAAQFIIGGSLSAGEYFLPTVSMLYKERYPSVEPILILDNSTRVIARIVQRELDLGFIGTEAVEPGLVTVPCWQDDIVVIGVPGSSRSGAPTLTLSSLRSRPFVMREPGSATRQQVERTLQAQGVRIRAAMTVSSPEAVKRHVAAGVGWGFASRCSIEAEVMTGRLAVIDIKGWHCRRNFCAVYRSSHTLSPPQARYLEIAKTLRHPADADHHGIGAVFKQAATMT